ncbi:MAG TPA: alpha-glucan family phosphorylase [Saprospiraceae bacterium]|nr:alpha-glucan family phosphorylase [Saprospiraceae bacterium]HMP24031.1 alpha-glucan family phosphorylase [Saprospiraceae bacterium]
MVGQLKDSRIQLKRIYIESRLPQELEPLQTLAQNIWWSWNKEAIALFDTLSNGVSMESMHYNPIALLDEMSLDTAQRLLADKDFMKRLQSVNKAFQAYINEQPAKDSPRIAYFCMEYGLHISLRLYSGGLGVLAGDYLKEASDLNVNMVAVGLLYRYGYFQQAISLHGDQIHNYPPQKFTQLPVQPVRDAAGEWLKVAIDLQGRTVHAKIWELKVGRISLYLLDTDIPENAWEDRVLTHQLYGGNNEHRLKQEILLGIGGMRALKALGIQSDVYHCNEGHAAFLNLERLQDYLQQGLDYEQAREVVRASSLFTTHTPVPAGHDYFSEGLLRNYLYNYINGAGIGWERFVALGKVNAGDPSENFSMSHLAIRLSQEVNGVSQLHGSVSQKMFNVLYQGYSPEELHISYVTNSVHYPTWIANEWDALYRKVFGEKFLQDQSNKDYWRKIHKVPDAEIMDIRYRLKKRLLDHVKAKLQTDLTRRGDKPGIIFEMMNSIQPDALVIGFARRFATYKRAQLLFTNLERLSEIVNQTGRPVMFLFAGKAHPADQGGQDLIKHIINISHRPEFMGKVIFLEDYNMELAKLLVQGVDIWLNTPIRPKEASGTSGMKAALNGVVNFSVLDGWWAEGYLPGAGWALPLENTYEDGSLQNELDAETIYNVLEDEIIPIYFDKNETGISPRWAAYVKNIIAEVAPDFTMTRMMNHYFERFYHKLAQRSRLMHDQGFATAKAIVQWKQQTLQQWNTIEVVEMDVFDTDNYALPLGERFQSSITLHTSEIAPEHIGLEVVFFKRINDNELELKFSKPFELKSREGRQSTYCCDVELEMSGVYEYGFRVFPTHKLLPHRQDFNLVKWL